MERRSASLVTTHSELVDTVLTPRAAANFRSILTSRSSKTILDFAQLRAPSGRGLKFVVLRSLWVSERSSDLATPWRLEASFGSSHPGAEILAPENPEKKY